MTLEGLQTELQDLINQVVTFNRVAGNSIIVYFFGEPGDDGVVSVFIDPSWRYQKNGKIVLGSYDLLIEEDDFNSKGEYEDRFEYLCSLTDSIKGSKLIRCSVDLESSDITMEFSGSQILRNFANSAFDDKHWTYRNRPKQLTACAAPIGVTLREEKK